MAQVSATRWFQARRLISSMRCVLLSRPRSELAQRVCRSQVADDSRHFGWPPTGRHTTVVALAKSLTLVTAIEDRATRRQRQADIHYQPQPVGPSAADCVSHWKIAWYSYWLPTPHCREIRPGPALPRNETVASRCWEQRVPGMAPLLWPSASLPFIWVCCVGGDQACLILVSTDATDPSWVPDPYLSVLAGGGWAGGVPGHPQGGHPGGVGGEDAGGGGVGGGGVGEVG